MLNIQWWCFLHISCRVVDKVSFEKRKMVLVTRLLSLCFLLSIISWKAPKNFSSKEKKKRFEIGEVKCQTIVKSWRSSNHYWKNAHNNDGAQGKKVTLLLPNALGKGRKRSRWHACSSSLFSPHRITEALETLLARNSTLERAKNGMKEEKQKILSSPVIVALTSEKPPWDN